jgi:hypothetical protein
VTTFNPRDHIRPIKTKQGMADYLPVAARLAWLRDQHPDATVETEMMVHLQDEAIFRAKVTLPNGASATGWGSETRADFPAGHLEKAETKSLGRALAALGYGTLHAGDELDEGDRVVDTPQDRPTARSATHDGPADVDIPSPFAAAPQPDGEFAATRALLEGMVKDGLAESDIVKEMNAIKPHVSKALFTELRGEYQRLVAERGGTSPPAVSQPSTAAQRIAIRSLLDLKRVPDEAVTEYALWQFGYLGTIGPEFAELTRDQADAVLGWLKREASRNPAHGLAKVAT